MTVPGALIAAMLSAGTSKVWTYHTTDFDGVNRTVYTFSSMAIGSAAADRGVIVGVVADEVNSTTVSSTDTEIGGVAPVITQASSSNLTVCLLSAIVPTGTTADVVIRFSAGKGVCHIGVWSCTGMTTATPLDYGSSTSDPGSDTLTAIAGGVCFAVAGSRINTSLSWSNITEQYDTQSVGVNTTVSGASITTDGSSINPSGNFATADTQVTVFATF